MVLYPAASQSEAPCRDNCGASESPQAYALTTGLGQCTLGDVGDLKDADLLHAISSGVGLSAPITGDRCASGENLDDCIAILNFFALYSLLCFLYIYLNICDH